MSEQEESVVNLKVATAPKTAFFQMRVNPLIREKVEELYAGYGLTLTEAVNIFFQQTLNVGGLPFRLTSRGRKRKV